MVVCPGLLPGQTSTRYRSYAMMSHEGEPRSFDVGGYKAPAEAVTWKPFAYSCDRARRLASACSLPPVFGSLARTVLLGTLPN